ncbi:stage III sporulation protein AG [Lysinibacillus parviboronicapiens]|uniref:Stage III sporulation protein AG n=2 Tax=Lysinibacillus parviboronicapiens TaxID=436516 RepID=A0ABV2PN73_9BACI
MEKTGKKTKSFLVLMLIAASVGLFIVLPMFQTSSTNERVTPSSNEEKLEQTLRAMQGVGEVKVYFYYGEMTNETDENNLFSQYFRGTDKGVKDITGMLIVSEGASDIFVKNEIRAVVSQVMQLPIHRIIIVPMENKGEK